MESTTIIGMIAASLTSISFLPQVIRIIQVKETRDISLGMYLLFTTGILLWLIYGQMKKDIVIITANTVTITFSSIILFFKLKYK